MDASDRLVGETFTVELGVYQLAALFEGYIKFLDVCRGQFVQLGTAKGWYGMLINPSFIGRLGVGAEVRFLVPLIPEVQPVRQQDSGFRLVRHKLFRRFPELCQLCRAFRLGFGEDIFGHRQAHVIVAHYIPAFPTTVFSRVETAITAVSALCHGAISSPK